MCFEEFTIFTLLNFFPHFLPTEDKALKSSVLFERSYRRLKHFIWLWGATCWKTACVIADTGVQLTSD